ncbi:hypothetical protein YTPLAS18_28050 [Nitrospira sp.]|nr:hypothetical protein YTPLAS18_28050 [Nitrospira sp.]
MRIALLHLAPVLGEITRNRDLIQRAVVTAAEAGATWIVTPELSVCGYGFADLIGTRWIVPQPDDWMSSMCRVSAQRRITLFLSHPEQDRRSARLYNSLFVLTPDGTIAGVHRKINALRTGSESWSTPGRLATPVPAPPLPRVGLLICADAFTRRIAWSLRAQGAKFLVSAAAWAPGFHGPNGEWEQCTRDTGLPLIVCNRTGTDSVLDFTAAESVVVADGRRLLSLSSAGSVAFLFDWDLSSQSVVPGSERRLPL